MGSTRHPDYFPDIFDDVRAARCQLINTGVVAHESVLSGESSVAPEKNPTFLAATIQHARAEQKLHQLTDVYQEFAEY